MFSNLRGCDGGRLYFNGGSSVTLNGHILNRGRQFALEDVEVTVATFDLEDIRSVIPSTLENIHTDVHLDIPFISK